MTLRSEELTYARCAKTRAGRAFVRGVENVTGRKKLIRRFMNYEQDIDSGKNFWEVMWERFSLELDLPGNGLDAIPKEGPLVVVANHPYGILDGLTMAVILHRVRPDFKILANEWLVQAPEIMHHILPISREGGREALRTNVETRRAALNVLKSGGCVAVFPAGTIGSPAKIYQRAAFDSHWKNFTATLINMTGATVMPILFEGQNSRLWQLASHLNETLRLALLINEFDNHIGKPVRVRIGDPLGPEILAPYQRKPQELMHFLRSHTYSLSPDLIGALTAGKPWG